MKSGEVGIAGQVESGHFLFLLDERGWLYSMPVLAFGVETKGLCSLFHVPDDVQPVGTVAVLIALVDPGASHAVELVLNGKVG